MKACGFRRLSRPESKASRTLGNGNQNACDLNHKDSMQKVSVEHMCMAKYDDRISACTMSCPDTT